MSVSIISCPSCKAFVLPDTAQCPNCHHVFDETRAAAAEPAHSANVPSAADSSEEEVPCPGCNELVRKGLVRCWNCGTFMQHEIAETYRRMQITPPRVIYSEIDEPDQSPISQEGLIDRPTPASPVRIPDEADFEVSREYELGGADEDFDLDESGSGPRSSREELLESAPVYILQESVEPEAKAPAAPAAKGAAAKGTAEAPAKDAKKGKSDPQTEFPNEFENRFGIDDLGGVTGDGLLRVALAEEAELGGRRRALKHGEGSGRAGFRVFCPNGHRVEVQERHRGLTGRCPRCREPFIVPANNWDEEQAQVEDEAKKTAAITASVNADDASATASQTVEVSAGEYTRWMLDTHFHAVDLTKLKLKPGSLVKDFSEVDVGFAPDGILVVSLVKKGGLLGGGGEKKKLANRDAVLDHLSHGKGRDQLPGGANFFFAAANVSQIRVVQPVALDEQSMFAGVPVFGEGRIAVRLPKLEESASPQFLSFSLSEFRRFSKILTEFYGVQAFGEESGIPLEDLFNERYCHFSDAPLRILENIPYYKDDPGLKLKLIGHKCASCGLVVSEESREKEKIGGANGKKIAKAKCPKCQKPFGDLPLYTVETPEASHAP